VADRGAGALRPHAPFGPRLWHARRPRGPCTRRAQRSARSAATNPEHRSRQEHTVNHEKMIKPMLIGVAALAVLGIAGLPVLSYLPLLIILACPLMMIFMMGSMGHDHSSS